MRFLSRFTKQQTELNTRWIWRYHEGADDACGISLDELEALSPDTNTELQDLGHQIELQKAKDILLSSENPALQAAFLSGAQLSAEQLNLTEGIDPALAQAVLEQINQTSFSARLELVSPEAIAVFISSDTQTAILKFAQEAPGHIVQLPSESQQTLLAALADCPEARIRLMMIVHLNQGEVANFVELQPQAAVELFANTPEALKSESTSITLKYQLLHALVGVQDETLRGSITNGLPQADLIRVISDEPKLIPELFTRREGNIITATFYDNPTLKREISVSQIIPADQETYVKAYEKGYLYRSTDYGYRAFDVFGIWGNAAKAKGDFEINEKAQVFDGNQFEVITSLNTGQKEALGVADNLGERPDSIYTNINQAYALNFKTIINSMAEVSGRSQSDDVTKQVTALRTFLDGDRFLLPDQAPNLALFEGTALAGLTTENFPSYGDHPDVFRAKVSYANDLVVQYYEQQILVLLAEKEGATSERKVEIETEIQAIQSALQASGENANALLSGLYEDSVELQTHNQQVLVETLQGLNFTPEQISDWQEAVNSAKTVETRTQQLSFIRGEIVVRLRDQGLEDPEETADQIMYQLNRQLNLDATVWQAEVLNRNLNTYRYRREFTRTKVRPVLKFLQTTGLVEQLDPSVVAAIEAGSIDASHIAQLEAVVQANEAAILSGKAFSDSAPAVKSSVFLFLEGHAREQFVTNLREINQASLARESVACRNLETHEDLIASAQATEAHSNLDGTRSADTPEAEAFWQRQDAVTEQFQTYFDQHGEIPPPEVQQALYDNVLLAEKQDALLASPEFSTQPEAVQEDMVSQLTSIPRGANLVDVTADGQYIIQMPGNQDTRFIQDPKTGGIVGEKFNNVADRDDLITTNWPLAQVYAAVAGGNVTQGLARITAQSAEHGGHRAMSQYMENLMNAMYRRSDYTFSPNQLHQWEQLGQRMEEYDLVLDDVFERLGNGRRRFDDTIDPGTPADGTELVALLEASVAENREGFERLLGLNSERPRQLRSNTA